jgi:hypothetical protein
MAMKYAKPSPAQDRVEDSWNDPMTPTQDRVERSTKTISTIDVTITPDNTTVADEYVLTINGRHVRRFTQWQAEKMGIVYDK